MYKWINGGKCGKPVFKRVCSIIFTARTQGLSCYYLNYPHFINSMCITEMGVVYVDIYVYNLSKKFFVLKTRIFTAFHLTYEEFFYTIKVLFSKIQVNEGSKFSCLYRERFREGGAFP